MQFKILGPIFFVASALAGCSSSVDGTSFGGITPSGTSTSGFSGVVSAGLVNGATVTAYALKASGSNGAVLATGTTDAKGNYTLSLPAQSGPVVLIATGGSYAEEASGATVSLGNAQIRTVLATTSANQKVGITPITEIASQYAMAAISANSGVSVANVINTSNITVAKAMGLTDITTPPADPSKPATSATSAQAAQYSVVLGTISQIAKSASTSNSTTISSLDIAQALATSLTYNGTFQDTVGGSTNVPVPNASGSSAITLSTVLNTAGGSSNFSAAMSGAMNTYLTTTADASYRNTANAPTPTYATAPSLPAGTVTITPPSPPANLPVLSSTTAGPPPLPNATPSAAPILYFNPNQDQTGTENIAMDVPPSTLDGQGAMVTNCTISPSLPAGLSIDQHTCVISGTPTALAATATYAVTATNAAGSSQGSTVTLSVSAPGHHVFIADSNEGGILSCSVNATSGVIGNCSAPYSPQGGGTWGISAIVNSTSNATLYIAAEGGSIQYCSVNLLTGNLSSCGESEFVGQNGTTPIAADKAILAKKIGNATFVYDWGSNGGNGGIFACTTDSNTGAPAVCAATATGLTLAGTTVNGTYTPAGWNPNGMDIFTNTGGTTYAYVISNGEGSNLSDSLYVCAVDSTSGALTGCSNSGSGVPMGFAPGTLSSSMMYINSVSIQAIGSNTYMYLAGYSSIFKCQINSSTGAIVSGSCAATQGGIATGAWSPVGLSFSNLGGATTYAYVSDSTHSEMYVCSVSNTDGTLSGCAVSASSSITNNNPWGTFSY
jgi:hypothetical protein